MDAIALLKADHDKVKKMLAEGEATTERAEKTRTELFDTLKAEMLIHERIEEEIFYPALKSHPKARDIVLEGYEEHHVVDEIMGELETTPVTDETWGAKVQGHEGEHRAPHRGGRGRDVQAGSPGLRCRRARPARGSHGGAQAAGPAGRGQLTTRPGERAPGRPPRSRVRWLRSRAPCAWSARPWRLPPGG